MPTDELPPLTAAERRMLVHGSDKAREEFMAGRSDIEHRRLERTAEKEAELERRFAGKLTTRKDVIAIIEMYNQRKILPLAAAVDEHRAALNYLLTPWWRRWWIDLRRLASRFRRMEKDDGQDAADQD